MAAVGEVHAYAVEAFVVVLVAAAVEERQTSMVDLVVEVEHRPWGVAVAVDEEVLDWVPIAVVAVAMEHLEDRDCNSVDLEKTSIKNEDSRRGLLP